MSGFLVGMFVGVVVGLNIGLIILAVKTSNWKVSEKLLKDRVEKVTAAPRPQKDPYETTVIHYCFACNHKWREYPLLSKGPTYCPNCGRLLDEEEVDGTEPAVSQNSAVGT